MKPLAVFAAALLLAPLVYAQRQTLVINANASAIEMQLNTTHEVVNGTFHLQSGAINFDRSTSQVSGMIVVAAGSGSTGNGSRDKKMNKEILRVDEFATVSFAPKTLEGTIAASGDSNIHVSGAFTLLGTSHELTIPLQVHLDGSKATVKGQFDVPYIQWGLKDPSFLFWKAEKTVTIRLSLVGDVSN